MPWRAYLPIFSCSSMRLPFFRSLSRHKQDRNIQCQMQWYSGKEMDNPSLNMIQAHKKLFRLSLLGVFLFFSFLSRPDGQLQHAGLAHNIVSCKRQHFFEHQNKVNVFPDQRTSSPCLQRSFRKSSSFTFHLPLLLGYESICWGKCGPTNNWSFWILSWLVVSIPLKNIWKSVGVAMPNIWKNKSHVPNHQPVRHWFWVHGGPLVLTP